MPEEEVIEIRCPVGPRRLLSRLILRGGQPRVTDGNLVEFSCDYCKTGVRRKDPSAVRVLHRYDLSGALVESLVVR